LAIFFFKEPSHSMQS